MSKLRKQNHDAISAYYGPIKGSAHEATHNAAVLSNLNYTIILSFAFILLLLKSYKTKAAQSGILHNRLQMLGGLILNFSILFSLVFSGCITIVSSEYKLLRHNIELLKAFEGTLVKSYWGYSVDLVTVMTFSLKISEILFISSLFFLIAALVPKGSNEDALLDKYNLENTSLGSLSILWAVCRIPVHLYLDAYRSVFEGRLAMFIFDLITLSEIFIAAIILLTLRVKRTLLLEHNSHNNILLLSFVLIFYGLVKYAVNLISMPFPLDNLGIQVITSAQFSMELSLYFLISVFFNPEEVPQTSVKSTPLHFGRPQLDESGTDVVLIPPTIEFDDKTFSY